MNSVIKLVAITGMCIAVSGCVTREQRMQQSISSSTDACVSMGFRYGTPELSNCVQNMVSSAMAEDARRRASIGALGRAMMSTPPSAPALPTPTPINCRSVRNGLYVNTQCY